MYDSEDDLRALLGVGAESVSLDFKDGIKLNNMTNDARKELVVDVTAMANSGGGTIIYGIAEQQLDGRSLAGTISPVTDDRVTQDRLREIVYSNTDPAFSDFKIKCIPVAQGNVFVVEVAEGDTAFQNKIDRRYYNRVDASSVPMYGYAIRDVMNRRTRPILVPSLQINYVDLHEQQHRYVVTPALENIGRLTVNHWTLSVGLPVGYGFVQGDYNRQVRGFHPYGNFDPDCSWFEFSSERHPGSAARILPGETRHLGQDGGYGLLEIRISAFDGGRLLHSGPSLRWVLCMDDSPKSEGEVPYDQWCRW
ncbi:AlbA family DNA-binding domain-containing protein [Ralstonia holmesii]|uniref:AlbA family DNA-binding domain-containing protein n=1 Tax=Ralstonia TaxID=48736 RepID=UPI0004690F35|nr:ATP-binding protein [Ralstonia pickettii]